jgi:hypothetical protein
MDVTSKAPPRELHAEGKAGEVDGSLEIEMQGSNISMSARNSNAAEMGGASAGVEILRTMEGSTFAGPVELYARPYGLREYIRLEQSQ